MCYFVYICKVSRTIDIFTARCALVQSAVLQSHVVCLSVCVSVTLVDCDHSYFCQWREPPLVRGPPTVREFLVINFYRAMHFRAKRVLRSHVVCLSLCDVGGL